MRAGRNRETTMYERSISALPKGTAFVRVACALAITKGSWYDAQALAERKWLDTPSTAHYLKTAIAAGTTSDSVWAGPLAYADNLASSDFAALLRDGSIAGRLKGLRHVPLNVRYP